MVIEVAGIGYLVHVTGQVLAGARGGERIRLLTQLVVREDSLTLYGFTTGDQRDLFQLLLGVNGVGPKLALAVLSVFEPEALRRVVAAGDVEALTAVPGIGKRSAQRLVLELKEHLVGSLSPGIPGGSHLAEVREALVGLGYTPAELRPVLDRLAAPGGHPGAQLEEHPEGAPEASLESLLRQALKELSRT
jgi:Holliday junction DNA helicase RuvA